MNIRPKNRDALSGNLLVGDNSPDAKSLAVLAELDISALIIASAPLPHFRWQIGDRELPHKSNEQGTSFAVDDWGIQYYIALWHRHLSQHPQKVEFARHFDEFEDPFKRNFPFCQADVIRVAVREGVEALLPYFAPLKQLLDTK